MTKQNAIKWLQNLKMDIGKTQHQELWHYEQALDEIIKALEQEPKREIELLNNFNLSKRAKWIDKQEQYQTAICSNCFKVTIQEKWGVELRYYDYCPNCGARMESNEQ